MAGFSIEDTQEYPGVVYFSFPNHPHTPGCSKKQTSLCIGRTTLSMDHGVDGELIGIEVLTGNTEVAK